MVIGHASSPFHDFIYLFHMPLFFMISGFFFNPEKIFKKKAFLIKKLNRLYIPFVFGIYYFCFCTIFFINMISIRVCMLNSKNMYNIS